MLQTKDNYKNKYENMICRGCGQTTETQNHILNECKTIHTRQETKIYINQIFSDEINTLREVATKLNQLTNNLKQMENKRTTTQTMTTTNAQLAGHPAGATQ